MIAEFNKYRDKRTAFARVHFSTNPVHNWELAEMDQAAEEEIHKDHLHKYGVDSGTGCFIDPSAINFLKAEFDDRERYYDFIQKRLNLKKSLIKTSIGLESRHNLIIFTSDFGDGIYPSYWGLDSDHQIVCLVTDFLIYDRMDWFYSYVEKRGR